MTTECNIGKEAKEIDRLPIKEKMKISKNTLHKFLGAIGIYFLVMTLFFFTL
jgi:hypothetical protein